MLYIDQCDKCEVNIVPPETSQDVVLACGCSGALSMAIDVLLNPGDNILLSKPGFSIYQTISVSRDHEVRHYNLLVRCLAHEGPTGPLLYCQGCC